MNPELIDGGIISIATAASISAAASIDTTANISATAILGAAEIIGTAEIVATAPRRRRPSPRALGPDERQEVLDLLHSEENVDKSPEALLAELRELRAPLRVMRAVETLASQQGAPFGGAHRRGLEDDPPLVLGREGPPPGPRPGLWIGRRRGPLALGLLRGPRRAREGSGRRPGPCRRHGAPGGLLSALTAPWRGPGARGRDPGEV
ncbi:MAG: hypothetical protein IPK80_03350 [Nannocystis sp.]|nr:hypothetical protein [Nannocystis sp.]